MAEIKEDVDLHFGGYLVRCLWYADLGVYVCHVQTKNPDRWFGIPFCCKDTLDITFDSVYQHVNPGRQRMKATLADIENFRKANPSWDAPWPKSKKKKRKRG